MVVWVQSLSVYAHKVGCVCASVWWYLHNTYSSCWVWVNFQSPLSAKTCEMTLSDVCLRERGGERGDWERGKGEKRGGKGGGSEGRRKEGREEGRKGGREGGREGETERDLETERDREKQKDRERQRETERETERQRDREKERQRERETEREREILEWNRNTSTIVVYKNAFELPCIW